MSSDSGLNGDWKLPPGCVGNLTESQQLALDTIKTQLQDARVFVPERMNDPMLLRFLRARKWDIDAAKKMLVNAENWRKEFGVDELVEKFKFEERRAVDKYYPQYYHKIDKEGRPIYIERLGLVSLTELRKITSQERQLQALVVEQERLEAERFPACSRVAGHPVETCCTILDLQNTGIKIFWDTKDYTQKASQLLQDYYPERMGKFYIINAPWGFSTVWNVIKGWLDPVISAKISVIGGDGRKEILAQIDPQNLPVELGGQCSCQDGCSLSDAGPWEDQTKH